MKSDVTKRGRRRLSKPTGALRLCLIGLNYLLAIYNRTSADGRRTIGHETRIKRITVLEQVFRNLNEQGYKLKSPQGFRGKHLRVLLAHWLDQGLSPGTIQTRLSILRLFCRWIDKPSLVETVLVAYPEQLRLKTALKRTYVATDNKAWEAKGIDPLAKIKEIEKTDPNVAVQLLLQYAFGLRGQEAMLLRPKLADRGPFLAVRWGTKGKRPRDAVEIKTEFQRQVLEKAKKMAPTQNSSTIPRKIDLKKWRSRYYYVLGKHEITRKKLGVVGHGLRHKFCHQRYEALTGVEAPIVGSGQHDQLADRETDRYARQVISEEIGHSRIQITNCYMGSSSVQAKKSPDDEKA